jgi:ABC-2 type transport system ATP-binding protein
MKMELITALLHDPKILFLDEPTIGLDAVAQRQFRSFLREVNRNKGTTIILTSHYMDDVRILCPRSIVVNKGKKLYDGPTADLFASFQTHKKISVRFDAETAFDIPAGAVVLEQSPYKAVFMLPKEQSGAVLSRIMQDYSPEDITVEEEDIGSVVERIYAGASGGTSGEAPPGETGRRV